MMMMMMMRWRAGADAGGAGVGCERMFSGLVGIIHCIFTTTREN